VLFDTNNAIPSVKSFSLMKLEPIEITLFYDPVPEGFQPILCIIYFYLRINPYSCIKHQTLGTLNQN
jgi:hypothetical protein